MYVYVSLSNQLHRYIYLLCEFAELLPAKVFRYMVFSAKAILIIATLVKSTIVYMYS